MRYSSHMEPLAARTLASHYTVMRQRYALTFSSCFDDSGRQICRRPSAPMLADPHFPALLEADQVATLQHATGLDEDALAFALLPLAAACARPDLSHFNVGAIARGVSGRWYFGGNMEFLGATMQQTVHAEQSAISHAWLRGETSLRAITVNYTPCGHCRQFMNELNSGLALRIHLPGREAHALEHYLPDAFGPKDLEIKTLLMDETGPWLPGERRCPDPGSYSGRQPLPCALQPLAFPAWRWS
ncbi:cytidine deaminase [Klebsiella pneumoniae]|uniref:Cytidine deaminase n=1 Tax=Klebsiella pneumoniae TaxID=573 RepID=A0A378AMN6_KLEPN|nr:cytidine deaminase [Klebsiella pneumoniae]